jgi:tetratricopeptide (TPR) repeat protein
VQLADRTLNLLVESYGEDFLNMSRAARRDATVEREREIAFAEKDRAIFYAEQIDLTQFGGARLVPAGYVHQLLRPGEPPLPLNHVSEPFPSVDPADFMECHLAGVALYREATWLAWDGRVEDAQRGYRRAAEIAWDIAPIVRNCALGFLELSDFEEAERLFTRTLELEPLNQDALYDYAGLLAFTGRNEEAVERYAQLDALETGFAEVSLNYAAALLAVGRLEEAGRQAEKALSIAADLEPARQIVDAVRQGVAMGGPEGVLEAQRLAGSLTVDGTLQLAQRYLDRGDWERATELYREAASQAPDQAGATYGLGYGLLRVGRYREAADAFRRLLAIDPQSADARNALAFVFAQTGDSLQVAERLAQEALTLNPALAPYWRDTLGWVRFRAGRHADALAMLTESERTLPVDDLSGRAENHYHLGKVMLALGRPSEARAYFRESASRARNEPWVADLRARQRELGDGGPS